MPHVQVTVFGIGPCFLACELENIWNRNSFFSRIANFRGFFVFSFFVRPLLDNGLKGGNSESPERASICNHFGVCIYVYLVVIKLQVTVFDPVTKFFENMFFRTMGKSFFFLFF